MTVVSKSRNRLFFLASALALGLVLRMGHCCSGQTPAPKPFPVSASISFQEQSTPTTTNAPAQKVSIPVPQRNIPVPNGSIPVREVNDVHAPQSNTIIPVVNQQTAEQVGSDIVTTSCIGCNNSVTSPSHFGATAGGFGYDHPPLFTGGCSSCGAGGDCFPGQKPCHPCGHHETAIGRFACGLYDCLCCPNPCYEGKWIPIADSAFFVEGTRPITQQRLRWDSGVDVILPDRSEYFWARADGSGKGPTPTAPALVSPRLHYNELSMYTEVALEKIGIIVETPYRSVEPEFGEFHAGFGDISIATKTLIFDCELLQVAFQMKTITPVGSARKGLGPGHVSLEPSLLFAIRLHEEGYFQGQISEWIPLGGDPDYAGAILHYHFSVNQTLFRPLPDVPIIGTLECSGFSFQDGAYTDPVLGPFQQSSGTTYFHVGAGLRMFVCDRIDFGIGLRVPITSQHWASQLYRSEFRWRY